jgi:hypothetical protein
MKTKHSLERIGRDLDRIGTGVLIGIILCSVSGSGGVGLWPFILAGSLIAVGGWLEYVGWRLGQSKI